jgi:preprotein translocase subunit SecA
MDWEENQNKSPKIHTQKKIRPNDKVNVRHSDGRMEFDVKYKRVVDEIKNGKCQII